MAEHHHHQAQGTSLPISEGLDPGTESLADALRLSFRILRWIMIVLLVGFLLSGMFSVQSDEVGLVVSLGKLDKRIKEPGIHFAWPFFIDEKIRLPGPSNQQSVISNAFWVRFNSPEEELRPLIELAGSRSGGLIPNMEGSLLCGDHTIYQAKWSANFELAAPLDYVGNIYQDDVGASAQAVRRQMGDLVRTTLESAVVQVSGQYGIDEVLGVSTDRMQEQVKALAQAKLDKLVSGIRVRSVRVEDPTAPIVVKPSFIEVTSNESRKQEMINAAKKEADKLREVAGENYLQLLEAIREYEATGKSPEVMAQIEQLLESASGEVSGMLQNARAQRDADVKRVRAHANEFQKLLPEFRKNPEIVLAQKWQPVLQEVLTSEEVKKYNIPEGVEMVINVEPDREIERERERKRNLEGQQERDSRR